MNKSLFPGGTIVLLSDPKYQALREKISGVYSAATRCGWQIFLSDQSPTAAAIRRIKAMLNPIGFVIELSAREYKALAPGPFGGTPVVLLGRDCNRRTQIFDCSCQDTLQPATAAIEVFRDFGEFACFGFIGHPANEFWSQERGSLFGRHTSALAPCFEYSAHDTENGAGSRQLVKWLRNLPKPCGLFLSTDHIAPQVFSAIHKAGIDIPGDMAVVSVDDIQEICLNVTPTLSSVRVNYFQCGENAVELLKRRLIDPSRPVEILTYGVVTVSKRASTRKPYTDKRVARAVEFIASNIASDISSIHVVGAMGCGRRQAEQLFKRHTGLSILHAIQKMRIEKAMALLQGSSIPIEEIPSFCGYDSVAFFKTIFRRETGMTMRAWRKHHRCSAMPIDLRIAAISGSRPRNALNTSSAGREPPRASTVSRNLSPTRRSAASSSSPASSNAP